MEEIVNEPIAFTPYLKSVIWGGNKICEYKGITQPVDKIGESWEISAVPGHVSVVEAGRYAGMTLNELIDKFGEQLLGMKVIDRYGKKFPLLIKLIDAADNLSVQVHPDDQLAMKRHNSLGKTEMWYIISTDRDAKIYAGLSKEITPDEYQSKVSDGTFTDVLATHDSNPGDVFFLPAGRVHAIGAGNLLAEIQESSDITYRIFDYNRRDANGNTRELHTELAKDAIDYNVYDNYKSERKQNESGSLVTCDHFNVTKILADGDINLTFPNDSFTVVMCIDGDLTYSTQSGKHHLTKGHTLLLPATMTKLPLTGQATILLAQS